MLPITFSRSFKIGWIRLSQTLDAKISPFLKLNLLRSHLTSPRLTSYHKSVNVGAYHGITPSLYPADISYMCVSQRALAWLAIQSKAVAAPSLCSKFCQKATLYIKGQCHGDLHAFLGNKLSWICNLVFSVIFFILGTLYILAIESQRQALIADLY